MVERYNNKNHDHRFRVLDMLNSFYGDRWTSDKDLRAKANKASALLNGEEFHDPQDQGVFNRFINKYICTMDANKPVWTRKNGTTMLIEDMDDGHLENAISMMEKKAYRPSDPVFTALLKERAKRFWGSSGSQELSIFEELGS